MRMRTRTQKPGAEPPARFVLSALCFPAGSCSNLMAKMGYF